MDYTPLHLPIDVRGILEPKVVTSLHEAVQQLSDARRGQGKCYELALILYLLI
jgi:hypothetical protein